MYSVLIEPTSSSRRCGSSDGSANKRLREGEKQTKSIKSVNCRKQLHSNCRQGNCSRSSQSHRGPSSPGSACLRLPLPLCLGSLPSVCLSISLSLWLSFSVPLRRSLLVSASLPFLSMGSLRCTHTRFIEADKEPFSSLSSSVLCPLPRHSVHVR